MASTRTTYVLWFLFGWTGLHHLYLGRLAHAFIWFATLGGGCGLGWVRDYWRIPDYIRWCNLEKADRKKFLSRAASNTKPHCSQFRTIGMTVMGSLLSLALSSLVPDPSDRADTDPWTYYALVCLTVALGVLGNALGIYLVANIGELTCSLFYPLVTSLCEIPLLYCAPAFAFFSNAVAVYFVTSRGIQWRRFKPETGTRGSMKTCGYFCVYCLACTAWLATVGVGIYLNGALSVDGEDKKISEHLQMKPIEDALAALRDLFKLVYDMGLWNIVDLIWKEYDISGKIMGYKTLGVFPGTNQETISKMCRRLLAETHPDRFKVPEEKAEAERRFLEIHKACAAISASRVQKQREQ